MARRMAHDPHLMPSAHEQELAHTLGFLLPTALPGGGFDKQSPFMQMNLVGPYLQDVLRTMQGLMGRVSGTERARLGYSTIPYGISNLSPLLGHDERHIDSLEVWPETTSDYGVVWTGNAVVDMVHHLM